MLRIYLSGEVQAERDGRLLRESTLGGPQGRFVLAYLVSERKRAVTQGELAEALWPGSLPASWTVALSAIISRLRSRLNHGFESDAIQTVRGIGYKLLAPN